jgi:hypothetical protein
MEWRARVFNNPPITLIQSDEDALYAVYFTHPDIYTVATWIRNRPGVFRMSMPDPMTDAKTTNRYTEYRFMVFPF